MENTFIEKKVSEFSDEAYSKTSGESQLFGMNFLWSDETKIKLLFSQSLDLNSIENIR